MKRRVFSCAVAIVWWLLPGLAPGQETYVALVLDAPARSAMLRPATELPLEVLRGDLVAAGATITAADSPLRLWYCPTSEELTLAPQSNVVLEARRWTLRSGSIAQRKVLAACALPQSGQGLGPQSAFFGRRLQRGAAAVGLPPNVAGQIGQLPAERQANLRRELSAIEQQGGADPDRPALAVVRGAIFEKYGMHAAAAAEYRRVAGEWSTVDWPRKLVHEQEQEQQREVAASRPPPAAGGKTFALVVGVSEYPNLRTEDQLQFAHRDATSFAAHLRSRRGGSLPEEHVRLLTNAEATTAAIRTAMSTFLRVGAGPADTVILFIAAHGIVDDRGAYILGYDSDPEDLATTALSMAEVQGLLSEESSKIGRVMLFIDVCRAGTIGIIRNNRMSRVLEVFLRGAETFGLLASGPGESSWESERFGGGHGAFSYFLLRGLGGDADEDKDLKVTADELFDYSYRQVRLATKRKQNPRVTGDMPGGSVMVTDTSSEGIALADWQPLESLVAQTRQGAPSRARQQAPRARRNVIEEEALLFSQALESQRILPGAEGSAFQWLDRLRQRLSPTSFDYLSYENELYVSLLDRGQDVLLSYLRGDEEPQQRSDFVTGAAHFSAALQIDPEAWAVESRALFCQGRALIFDKRYVEAVRQLERAARIDPSGAYIYNALGIAYLEQAQYTQAIAAFRDAIRLAPLWIYPRHNLALALTESGQAAAALAAFGEALRAAPDSWHLRYSEGLLLQRVGEVRKAGESLQIAVRLAPMRPEPYNALGVLAAGRRKRKEAEQHYAKAIEIDAAYLPAQHNLALLLADDPERGKEAERRWRELLTAAPGFLPARLALAEMLLRRSQTAEAIVELSEIVQREPEYLTARTQLADALNALGRHGEALTHWEAALRSRPDHAVALEKYGDTLRALNRDGGDVRTAYLKALAAYHSGKDRKRVRAKLMP